MLAHFFLCHFHVCYSTRCIEAGAVDLRQQWQIRMGNVSCPSILCPVIQYIVNCLNRCTRMFLGAVLLVQYMYWVLHSSDHVSCISCVFIFPCFCISESPRENKRVFFGVCSHVIAPQPPRKQLIYFLHVVASQPHIQHVLPCSKKKQSACPNCFFSRVFS